MSGKKKLLSALLCLMILGACCLAAPAFADGVPYIYYEWNDETEQLLKKDGTCTNAAALAGGTTELAAGWYTAEGTLEYTSRLTVTGHVRLILLDGCKVTANEGIQVQGNGSSLTIYAQSEGDGTGTLTATGSGDNAAIGGGKDGNSTITIHSGNIKATAIEYGAGIGGGYQGNGTVTIYGGAVSAKTNAYGAAIGGGWYGNGTVTIHGGKIDATTDGNGAGIGGGYYSAGKMTITGGTVTVTASSDGAGIGCGKSSRGEGTVEITAGSVTATASGKGAAIGNGSGSTRGSVTIKGGCVSARNTNNSTWSIGGESNAVSLGWTNPDDYVFAAGYGLPPNYHKVNLTKSFKDASSMDTATLSGEIPAGNIAGKMLVPPESTPQNLWTGANFLLPGSLTEVGANAFSGIRANAVRVPASVTYIGANAFSGSGLTMIRFLGGSTGFDENAFNGCGMVIAFAPKDSATLTNLSGITGVTVIPMPAAAE